MAVEQRHVQITSPCPVKLDPNRGKDGSRSWYCGHCEKSVHVLSNMTEGEARALLAASVGQDLCVSYAVRKDGTIRFRPEPPPALVPVSSLRRRVATAAAIGMSAALAACTPHDPPRDDAPMVVDRAEAPARVAQPTIPVADPTPPPGPEEPMVEGGIGPVRVPVPEPEPEPEPMIDGGLVAEPIPEPEPVPVPGGLRVAPLPPAEADEPCDTATTPAPVSHRRGGLARRRPVPTK